jgi:predicted permease
MRLGMLLRDVRYGFRMLRKNAGLTALVVLSLALGIGANTAIFSTIDALMLRRLPVTQPQSLYLVRWSLKSMNTDPFMQDLEGDEGQNQATGGATSFSISHPAYQRLQKNNTVFSETFAFSANSDQGNVGLRGKASTGLIQGVSGNLFAGLDVPAAVGRTILPSDDSPSAPPVAMVSYAFWEGRMGSDAQSIGKTITINGVPLTVVGVAPQGFFGVDPSLAPDVWIPLSVYAHQWDRDNMTRNLEPLLSADKIWWIGVVGRLKPGVSASQANAELGLLFNQAILSYSPKLAANADIPRLSLVSVASGLDSLRNQYSKSLYLLMGMVALVLLIACANVASLLMARAASRQREIAMRISLGASRAAIVRQLLTESSLLGVMGGVAALVVAHWAGVVLAGLLASGRDPVPVDLHLDLRVLAFTAAVSIVSGIVFGLAPSLAAIRVQPLTTLKQNSGNATMSAKRFRSGKILVGAQVALSLLLLIGAGLLIRTLQTLRGVNLGYDRQGVVLFTVRPGLNGYDGQKLVSYYEELGRRLGSIPGVRSVAFADRNPIGSGGSLTDIQIPGYTAANTAPLVYRHIVGPGYFDTLHIGVLLGRAIGEQDTARSQKVVLINQAMARKYFHGDNPIGHQVRFGSHVEDQPMQIVGVVQDVKYEDIRTEPPPTVYVAYSQTKKIWPFMTYQLRTAGDTNAVARAIAPTALAVDPDVPVVNIHTQEQMLNQVLYLERTFALLSSVFGGLALALACVGVYGTIAYTVAQRTNEIGIRMALGAQRDNILQMVLRETLFVVAIGLAAGLPLSWLGTRLLSSQIYGLSTHDPGTLAVAVLFIAAVTVAAGFVPARRASRVDPLTALRYE